MKIALPGRRSPHLRDRRGAGGLRPGAGGIPLPVPLGIGGGATGLLIVLAAIVLNVCLSGSNGGAGSPFDVFPRVQPGAGGPLAPASAEDEALVDFVSFVLDDVQQLWADEFATADMEYLPADLVLFTGSTDSACGAASASVGPFYCPIDRTAYLDLDFFRELHVRFGVPGDFAQAYVIAHELAHHVQNLTGVSDEVRVRSAEDPGLANELSVRLELQADCLAGVWGYSTYQRTILESGDLEEGLNAAAAIGDDRIQAQAGGRIDPDTWTHGSSEQRATWFRRGFDGGEASDCDTFRGDI